MKNKPISEILQNTVKRHIMLTIGLFTACAGTIFFGILPPLVMEKIVNVLVTVNMPSGTFIAEYVLLLAVAGLFDAAKEVMITVFGQKVTHETRSAMSRKLSMLPAAYYIKNGSGYVTSRMVLDVDTVETLFSSGIISMLVDVCKVVSILVIIFVKSRGLGLLMIIVTPVLFGFTRMIQKRMFAAQLAGRKAVAKANNHLPETIGSIRMIHNIGCEWFMKKKYKKFIDEGFEAAEKSNFYDAVYSPVIITISAVIVSVMMIFAAMGGKVTTFFGMSVGTAVAVISYVDRVFTPLESIGMEIQNIQSALAGIYRIKEFLSEEEIKPACEVVFDKSQPAIELTHVDFGYDSKQILKDYSLMLKEKECVTLAGRTGIGKSTIFKLILGLYEPWKGEVKIFGVNSATIPPNQRAMMIGYVEQSFHSINGNVMEQVTLKNPDISRSNVERAFEITGLLGMVNSLPHGMDTQYDENYFSQGQRQLLSIARAVAGNPPILLLDEITANLDVGTEKEVVEALEKASHNRTVLSISHRNGGKTNGEKVVMVEG